MNEWWQLVDYWDGKWLKYHHVYIVLVGWSSSPAAEETHSLPSTCHLRASSTVRNACLPWSWNLTPYTIPVLVLDLSLQVIQTCVFQRRSNLAVHQKYQESFRKWHCPRQHLRNSNSIYPLGSEISSLNNSPRWSRSVAMCLIFLSGLESCFHHLLTSCSPLGKSFSLFIPHLSNCYKNSICFIGLLWGLNDYFSA